MKKQTTLLAALLAACAFGSCAKNEDPVIQQKKAQVWATSSTEKVLQNRTDLYPESVRAEKISVFAARGEYESAQVIITGGSSEVTYEISANDLTGGSETFSKDNISLYHEKYAEVAKNYENTSAPAGFYPDALVPYEAIVKRGENTVASAENQGIYITFHIPETQPAGTYTGSLSLQIGGEEKNVPVELTIYDFVVSKEVHSKSVFLTQWHYHSGELDSTQGMMDAYTEKLIEYRLAPNVLATDLKTTEEDMDYYVDKAAKYLADPACSNLGFPYQTEVVDGETCIDAEFFKAYLRKFVLRSYKDNFDYCAKLTNYYGIIDEPQLTGAENRVKVVLRVYKAALEEIAREIEGGALTAENVSDELKAQIAQSVRNIRCVVTASYDKNLANSVDTWCPNVSYYDYEAEKYADQEEKWWYTCNNPKAPYPTLHTEDTLLSARTMGWMMNEYNITGNLYWAVNIYAQYENNAYKPLDDYFSQASHFPNVNGDGYLFYPGGQYGLSSPIASIRLEALRDGLEEYEIGYALKNAYANLPKENAEESFNGIYKNLTSSLYSGTRVNTTVQSFAAARRNLYELAALAGSEANVCLTNFTDDDYGHLSYEIYAKKGYELKNGGKTLTPVRENGDYSVYELAFDLSKDENEIALSVACGGKIYTFEKYLGGKVTAYKAKQFEGNFSVLDGATVEAELVPALTGGNDTWMNVKVGKAASKKWQNFKWTNELFSSLNAQSKKLVFHIYLSGDKELPLTVSAKYKNSSILSDLSKCTLKPGMNVVTISGLDAFEWDRLGGVEYLAFYLGAKKGNAAVNGLYIADVAAYSV